MGEEFQQKEPKVMSTAQTLTADVNEMVELENRGWGFRQKATEQVAISARLSFWTVENIRTGKTKNPSGEVIRQLRQAYIKILERHVTAFETKIESLKKEIEEEKKINDDTDLLVLGRQAAALESQIKARREKLDVYRAKVEAERQSA